MSGITWEDLDDMVEGDPLKLRDRAWREIRTRDMELARINDDLRRHGIKYPLGANGVHDLTNFAIQDRQTVLDVAKALGLPESTDPEPILEEISRLLAIEDGAQ